MNRTIAAITLAVFTIVTGAGLVCAQINQEYIKAPEFSADSWINSSPLTLGTMRGKVLLIDFWDYTCVSCIRTFPYLQLWHRLYGPLGLVLIGVHTPEFEFARDPQLVAEAVKRFGLGFPVAVDNERRAWRAFHNEASPCQYLIDKDGMLAYSHCGEGDYADMERLIQQLLKKAHPELDFNSPRFTPHSDPSHGGAMCKEPTPEMYLGYIRADSLANADCYQQLVSAAYRPAATLPIDHFDIAGQWLAMPEDIKHAAGAAGNYDSLRLRYRAKSVYLIAGSDDGAAIDVLATQDGNSFSTDTRGANLKVRVDGQSYLPIGPKRVYYLVENRSFGEHVLELRLSRAGASFYAFSFGGSCEAPFDHR
jgi:thiol-disulfide isomerase/thioredoxin